MGCHSVSTQNINMKLYRNENLKTQTRNVPSFVCMYYTAPEMAHINKMPISTNKSWKAVLELEYTRLSTAARAIFGAFAVVKSTISFVMSVCPSACNNRAPTGRISVKFYTQTFEKIQIWLQSTQISGNLHAGLKVFHVVGTDIA
jgi:hypothetical protein